MIETMWFDGSDQRVLPIHDDGSGVLGFVVVDNIMRGPAMGGCRLWSYSNAASALNDAQRLARGMSFKNAMAGLPLGGGKAVLCRPSEPFDRNALFRSLGRAVNDLAGDYLTAEDVGTSTADMLTVRSVSPYVFGLPTEEGRPGGNPSPWTALGVFTAMNAACARFSKPLRGMTVAVQGVGSVGSALCDLLLEEGADLIVSDISPVALTGFAARPSVRIADNDAIHRVEADIFAPCALGAGLNKSTISELGAKWIIGAANNQLATQADGDLLAKRGILYLPDYVVNAGGIINVAAEYLGEGLPWVQKHIDGIGERTNLILDRAEQEGITAACAADALARELLTLQSDSNLRKAS